MLFEIVAMIRASVGLGCGQGRRGAAFTSAARFHITPAALCMARDFVIIALGCEALPDNWDQYICINYTKRS